MLALIVRRLIQSVLVMLAVALLAFTLFRYVGDPISQMVGQETPIEERSSEEVVRWAGVRAAPAGAKAWNPAFDITPARLIAGWVTERGVERPPFPA